MGREVREEEADIRAFVERDMEISNCKITSKYGKLPADTGIRTRMGIMISEERM